eukprot:1424192-Amphidinium_carterae.1
MLVSTTQADKANEGSGGVAILARNGWSLIHEKEAAAIWQEQGRVMVSRVISPSGAMVSWLIAVYAFTDYRKHLEEHTQLFNDIGDWITPRARAPILLAGDINEPVESHHVLTQWLASGLMADLVTM